MASLALQEAIFAKLLAAPFQTACGVTVGVYDRVPPNAVLPYVTIGDDHEMADLAQGYDGSDILTTLVVWSREPGRVEAKRIAEAIRAQIAPPAGSPPPLSLEGHRIVTWAFQGGQPMPDLDGVTTKAIVKITYRTAPTA